MSETPPNDTPGITLADIRKLVTDTVAEVTKGLTPSGGGSTPPSNTPDDTATGRSVKEQVEAALAGITEKNQRAEREKTIDQQLKDLSEKVAEKPPVERRRVHRLMGWGE